MKILKTNEFNNELDRLLKKAEKIIPEEIVPDLPYMESVPDVHDWYQFELELWEIGEEIRELVSKYGKAFSETQINKIINICLDKKAKRGRQSFVMLLGRKVYGKYANKIISILNDEDVDGHVIDTIYKMQAGQYVDLIKPFQNHNRIWIQKEAKRYINKFEKF